MSEHELIMIAIVVPFALIFARILLMAYLSVRYGTESWRTYSGFYSIDAAIGFFAALVFTEFFTSLCKKVFWFCSGKIERTADSRIN